ncbi:MAG: InlB B-repeat-containing protein, partial [Nitrososphaerota archaeon]|nr:InlB B-repeat-containing protein [Nitrososphaerota archaeon]
MHINIKKPNPNTHNIHKKLLLTSLITILLLTTLLTCTTKIPTQTTTYTKTETELKTTNNHTETNTKTITTPNNNTPTQKHPTPTNNVTIHNSQAGPIITNQFPAGTNVSIDAGIRPDYIFTNWTINEGNITLPNSPQANFIMPTHNVTVTANWTPTTKYSIIYDTNGGNGTGYTVHLDESNLIYGNQHTVLSAKAANAGMKEGYDFTGWNTEPDGSGWIGGAPGNFIPEQHTFTATNITLYAQWKPEITPPPQPNIPNSTLEVIFFDVNQADCILLKTDNHTMLIDAGNTGQDKLILNYLAEYNITTLDYLVATHPHAD